MPYRPAICRVLPGTETDSDHRYSRGNSREEEARNGPPKQAKEIGVDIMEWSLEGPVLDDIIDTLGILLPVRIVKHQGGSQLLGTHQLKSASEAPSSMNVKTN